MPDLSLPVASLDEALPLLRRPFTPEAIKFKVQSVFKDAKGCVIVSYIDARLVIERLNAVCGPEWSAAYVPDEKALWCRLTVFNQTRMDVGTASGIEAEKGRVSDALKRAAVHFGVGVSVYALPQATWWADKHVSEGRLERRTGSGNKPTLVLTLEGIARLRNSYASWLEEQTSFGDPLDHGDVADAGGLEEEGEAEEFVAEKPEPLEDDEAQVLRTRIDAAYTYVDKRTVPVGKFRAWLDDAAHSHAELEKLAVYLEGLRS